MRTWVDSLVFWIFGPPFLLCLLFAANNQRSEYNGGYFFWTLLIFPVVLLLCAAAVEHLRGAAKPTERRNPFTSTIIASLILVFFAHICGSAWGFTTRERVQANLIFPDKYAQVWNFWMYARAFGVIAAVASGLGGVYREFFPVPTPQLTQDRKRKRRNKMATQPAAAP